jgi:hypothetical protein
LHNIDRPDQYKQREIRIKREIRHPINNDRHDIMLLELVRPVRYSRAVSPVCLPRPGLEFEVGTNCYLTGWGLAERERPQLTNTAVKCPTLATFSMISLRRQF